MTENKKINKITLSLLLGVMTLPAFSSTYALKIDVPGMTKQANSADQPIIVPDVPADNDINVPADAEVENELHSSCFSVYGTSDNIGNGVYLLDSGPYYCDMAAGGWTMIFKQSIDNGYYTASNALERNIASPGADVLDYSALKNLESFRRDGRFEMLIEWPRDHTYFNHWTQTTNPTVDQPVAGYLPIEIGANGNYWGGLERNCLYDCTGNSFIDGSVLGGQWFFAIASFRLWGNGIPSAFGQSASQTVLWVR